MCEWGVKAAQVKIAKPKSISQRTHVPVDPCIAPIVQALNAGEVPTVASCCGHGKRPGSIILEDGRELIIAPDFETARVVDKAFPPIQ